MQNSLPDRIDFQRQVELNATFEGSLPIPSLERLLTSLVSDEGEIKARVKFTTRAGIPSLDGWVEAELKLECQRCLQPMMMKVVGDFHFGLVADEKEIELLPDEFEPMLMEEGEQSLFDIIEDELILSLPIVPRHEDACNDAVRQEQDGSEEDTYRPFAGLKDLMTED